MPQKNRAAPSNRSNSAGGIPKIYSGIYFDVDYFVFEARSASHLVLLDFPAKEHFMHNAIPLILAALLAVGIIVIGCFYLVSPERISGTFGLKPPASDADTRAWLRPKGIRDIVAGLVVLAMMLTADSRLVGIALLVEAVIPFGDMSIVLGSGGSTRKRPSRSF